VPEDPIPTSVPPKIGFAPLAGVCSWLSILPFQRASAELVAPRQQRFRWLRLDDIADDVGIEQMARHSPIFRPFSRGRDRSRSAPTTGERRKAARMPPGLGGSPEIDRLTVARSADASGGIFRKSFGNRSNEIAVGVPAERFEARQSARAEACPVILDGALLRISHHDLRLMTSACFQ
jgi:hypothetical protein